jgi:hypothetical protein
MAPQCRVSAAKSMISVKEALPETIKSQLLYQLSYAP